MMAGDRRFRGVEFRSALWGGGIVVVAVVAVLGAWWLAGHIRHACGIRLSGGRGQVRCRSGEWVPISTVAGPPRSQYAFEFRLNEGNSIRMVGSDDPTQERRSDVAGNYYSSEFIRLFSYTNEAPDGPEVRLRVDAEAPTFRGRIEGRRLKPNFVYQLKLIGDYDKDPGGFEAIGYVGRWRLPGPGTNYSDDDYRRYPEKEKVESYIYFDYLLTDDEGNGVRDFELDSSLHITWNATRQRTDAQVGHLFPAIIAADDRAFYAVPKDDPTVELLWLERERSRYDSARQTIVLPPGHYQAALILTEETFHARDRDGGYWPTVMRTPVEFTVLEPVEDTLEDSQE